jgi:hypothetical protein
MRVVLVALVVLFSGCAPQESPETKYNNLTKMIEEKQRDADKFVAIVMDCERAMTADGLIKANSGKESELNETERGLWETATKAREMLKELRKKQEDLLKRRASLGF